MPFTTVENHVGYGLAWHELAVDKYCESDLSSCRIGRHGIALVFADPNNPPGCVSNNTCRVISSACNRTIDVYYDGSSVKKSAFNITWYYHIGTNINILPNFAISLDNVKIDTFINRGTPGVIYRHNLLGNNNIYIPFSSLWFPYWKPYQYGTEYIAIAQYTGAFSKVVLIHCLGYNSWVIGLVGYLMSAESSPMAIIPLDYDKEYLPYSELRKYFSYSIDGLAQFGWNAHDIIATLKDIYPNRAWVVFDDNQQILYLYNLTPDYVPDWLIERLTPTAMKVLKAPADATVAKAWLDLLNERNAQIPPQAELP
jgi:hypothetical protein